MTEFDIVQKETDKSTYKYYGSVNGSGASDSNGSKLYASNPDTQHPISVVNQSLSGDSAGDKLILSSIPNPMPESNSAGVYIVEQRTIIRNEKLAQDGNVPATEDEKKAKIKSYQDLEGIRKLLVKKCEEAGISFSRLSVLMTSLTGKTPKEFHMMNPDFQEMLLKYIIESIERIQKANLPDVDPLEAVVADAAMMYKFITCKDGVCVNIDSLTPEEIKERREYIDKEFKARKAQKMAEYEKLSPEEQKIAKEKFLKQMASERKHIFESLSKNISFESAFELLLIVSVQDLAEEAQAFMDSLPVEIREKIANTMHSIDTFKEYIKLAQGRGESLGDERAQQAWKQYNKIFGTYKTKEKFEEYEQQFVEARTRGELLKEVIKPSAMGIGEAAYANINMTTDEKHSFMQKWVADNNGYLTDSDIAEVEQSAKEYIKELLKKNPELKERFSYVKKTIKEIVEKTLNREFKPQKTESAQANKSPKEKKHARLIDSKSFKFVSNEQFAFISKNIVDFVKEHIRRIATEFKCPAIEKSESQVESALLRGIITEDDAIKNLNNSEHKFIKLCVKNSKLAAIYDDRINNYITKEEDDDKLLELAEVAPRRYVEKIVKKMHGDKTKLTEKLIKLHLVDYNTVVTLENTVLKSNVA